MYCVNCGSKNLESANFCKKCGNEIKIYISNQDNKRKKVNYYFDVLKKYAVFEGRSTRKEYWMFFLFNILIYFGLVLIEWIFGISAESLLVNIYQLVIFLPTLAVGVRRMHDVNKNGWYLLIPIYNYILLLKDGINGENEYGPNPKINN